jgi:hypothetical protein
MSMNAIDHVYFATRALEQARDALVEEGLVETGVPVAEELAAASQLAQCMSSLMGAAAEMSDILRNLTLRLSQEDEPPQAA